MLLRLYFIYEPCYNSAMNAPSNRMIVRLQTSPVKVERLELLQKEFAGACNMIAKLALQLKCWNRVALHHQVYHAVREKFPALGSQMVCNALYAVIRTHRVVVVARAASAANAANGKSSAEVKHPNLKFLANTQVFFDDHTLSFSATGISLFTPDGRLHFDWQLQESDIAMLSASAIKEATLNRDSQGFFLNILLTKKESSSAKTPAVAIAA